MSIPNGPGRPDSASAHLSNFSAWTGRGRLNRKNGSLPRSWNHFPGQSRTASHEVSFPFSALRRAALSWAAKPRDDPASTFHLLRHSPRVGVRQKVGSLRFFASRLPCAARAAGPRITLVYTGHSPRTRFSRGVPLPVVKPCTTSPDILRFQSGNAPGICAPFAVFLTRGSRRLSPCLAAWVLFRRSSPHAVIQSSNTADFYGCRPQYLGSFPHKASEERPTC